MLLSADSHLICHFRLTYAKMPITTKTFESKFQNFSKISKNKAGFELWNGWESRRHPVVALVGSQDGTTAQIGLFISATWKSDFVESTRLSFQVKSAIPVNHVFHFRIWLPLGNNPKSNWLVFILPKGVKMIVSVCWTVKVICWTWPKWKLESTEQWSK